MKTLRKTIWPVSASLIVAAIAVLLLVGASDPPAARADDHPATAAAVKLIETTAEAVTLEFTPPISDAGKIEAAIYSLEGELLGKVRDFHAGKPTRIRIPAKIDAERLWNYYVQYKFGQGQPSRTVLTLLQEQLETRLIGHRELIAGTEPVLRVLAIDRSTGKSIAGAQVDVELLQQDKTLARTAGRTDDHGQFDARLALPDRKIDSAQLKVRVKSRSESTIEQNVSILAPVRTMLTTDKPLYQPGQVIHIRALSLGRTDRRPLVDTPVLFEVEDSKGNKVFKKRMATDSFGVSSCDFQLATELNKGTYRIRATVGESREEKTVTVDRYVLPKFKVKFETDRRFYRPGDKVTVDLQADYFFGKPVAAARLEVTCSKFDVAYDTFKTVTGTTDDQGHYRFELTLPEHFVGQPLQQGKASVKFDVKVTDTADHAEELTRNVTVTETPILVTAVPEGGKLIPGLENRIYIVTTYADATPAQCRGRFGFAGAKGDVVTDEAGFGQITLTPDEGAETTLSLSMSDKQGNKGQAEVKLSLTDKADQYVLLRTDRSLYTVGDRLALNVHATRKTGTVFIDVLRDGQTWLTRTLDLKQGQAATKLDLESGLAGTVQINAWLLGPNGIMVRDRRIVMVDPANDLTIEVGSDSETYLPGEPAEVSFHVTDAAGNGVAAALCVMVVDEAVFALQEMQPGLEKIYFYLEKEIAKPRYEVHGWDLPDVWDDPQAPLPPLVGQPRPEPFARREQAAKVLLASAAGAADYSINTVDYQAAEHEAMYQRTIQQMLLKNRGAIQQALAKYAQKLKAANKQVDGVTLDTLVKEGLLEKKQILDPWGNEMKIRGTWCQGCRTYHGFWLASAGLDGKWGTADDADMNRFRDRARPLEPGVALRRLEVRQDAPPRPMAAMTGEADLKEDTADGAAGGASEPAVRVRDYFPETLLFRPAVITDASGRATLAFDMADSITTWRMTLMGNSAAGALGSTTAPLRVFQDFFVDIDFPVALTQNDTVHVPVVVYNYLQADQSVRLQIQRADWFELLGEDEITVDLDAGQVKAVHVPVRVRTVGHHRFQVTARGTDAADAIARSVEVTPDGKEHRVSHSGRLGGDVSHTLNIPSDAIDGASRIVVKVYPGVLSQVVEGLDSILRMPSGCFEQTSSTTYPNILVLDYMKTTGKITPELQMKAEGFINAGYQRLLSFECSSGGFEWFGKDPAHPILTAYGLMEFHDMSKVHDVDPAVIARTRQWLVKLQTEDGSYKPDSGGIREGAINKFTSDTFRNTAYITWALVQTGGGGGANDKAIAWMKQNVDDVDDPYTLALACNAFALAAPQDPATAKLLARLERSATHAGDKAWWTTDAETPTCGTGASADIETTALAVQALIKAKRGTELISKAVTYLAGNKDSFGTWQTTQATIQAMRAMILAETEGTRLTSADVAVKLNGKSVREFAVTHDNSDVMQLIDLGIPEAGRDHEVRISFDGEGGMMYQVVGRYYLPHPVEPIAIEPISIDVDYDRTELASNDIVNVTATIRNNRAGAARMVLVDLGLPPGFKLMPGKLEKLVKSGRIEKFSVTGRQIIVYLRELVDGDPIELEYQLLAKYPLRAKTPKSTAYEYYNPEIRGTQKPVELTVSK